MPSIYGKLFKAIPLAALLIAAVVFGAIPLSLAWLWARFFSPAKPGKQKNSTYECGLEAKGDAWVQINVSYYVYAIVFLIFDVEAVFLLPFAAAFSGLSLAACSKCDIPTWRPCSEGGSTATASCATGTTCCGWPGR